jgi:hypothetical protein
MQTTLYRKVNIFPTTYLYLEEINMKQDLELENIEKKAWQSYFQDGLFDIFFASLFIISGIGQIYDSVFVSLSIFIPVVIFILCKFFITVPRLGIVKFGKKRIEKQMKAHIALLITFIVTLIIFVLSASNQFNLDLDFSTILIIMFIAIFGSLAYFLDYPMFLLYGLMFAASEYIIRNYGHSTGALIFFCFGATLLVIGFYQMIRFLRKFPLPEKEVTNV